MSAEVQKYKLVEQWCHKKVSDGAEFLFDPVLFHHSLYTASKEFHFPFEALQSFIRNITTIHVKRTSHIVRANVGRIAQDYVKGTSILSLARKSNYPPYLFCRILVEAITDMNGGKRALTDAMRDPMAVLGDAKVILPKYIDSETIKRSEGFPRIDPQSSKPTTRLAQEVMEAIESDPMHGPRQDRLRHAIGIEYEAMLEKCLNELDVPFESEQALRERGTSRTPDVLLSCPMGVRVTKKDADDDGWRVICWIDSKALFGDVNTHQTSVIPQAESYVHRFGPGLILYWFGCAPVEMLDDAHGDIVISSWKLPEPLLFPTGEFTELQRGKEQEANPRMRP